MLTGMRAYASACLREEVERPRRKKGESTALVSARCGADRGGSASLSSHAWGCVLIAWPFPGSRCQQTRNFFSFSVLAAEFCEACGNARHVDGEEKS